MKRLLAQKWSKATFAASMLVHLAFSEPGDFDSEWFVSDAIRSYQWGCVADRPWSDFEGCYVICVITATSPRFQGLGICTGGWGTLTRHSYVRACIH
jgi:hypothetical protein